MFNYGDMVTINNKPLYFEGKLIGNKEDWGGQPMRVVGPIEWDGCYPLSPFADDDNGYAYFTEEHLDKL